MTRRMPLPKYARKRKPRFAIVTLIGTHEALVSHSDAMSFSRHIERERKRDGLPPGRCTIYRVDEVWTRTKRQP